MAKNFNKMNEKRIESVAKKSNESANVITLKMINDEDLLDYPKNREDVTMTEDLELSMEQNGFTDPLEVTTFNCPEGKYMIVSGHRRRVAGRKCKITTFPAIVRKFKSEAEVFNYVLLANSQRDSAKDPLLFSKRYKMHEECLKEQNFKGNYRDEIAKRLGLSVQQADRYNQMNRIVLPVWDMVREEKVGMSSVLPLSTLEFEEQEEIVVIFNQFIEAGVRLSRETCKKIIDDYKAGKKSFEEITSEKEEKESFMNIPITGDYINAEPSETKDDEPKNRNDEINYDTSHREGLESDGEKYADERLSEEDYEAIELADKRNKKQSLSEEELKLQRGKQINNTIEKLEKLLSEHYCFENAEETIIAMQNMTSIVKFLFDAMQYLTMEFDDEEKVEKKFNSLIANIQKDLNNYIEV